MELISRQEAKAQGLKRYFTGEPCKHGHVSERLVSTRQCCVCSTERSQAPEEKTRKAAVTAVWKAKNPEEAKARYDRWVKANPEKVKIRRARYRENNRVLIRNRASQAYATEPTKVKARAFAWYQTHKDKAIKRIAAWRKANPEKVRAYGAMWAANNPHILAANCAQRRAAKKQATPIWADRQAIKKIYDDCAFVSRVTGEKHHVDHRYPLQSDWVCGLHVPLNLQILTAAENQSKGNRPLHNVTTFA